MKYILVQGKTLLIGARNNNEKTKNNLVYYLYN